MPHGSSKVTMIYLEEEGKGYILISKMTFFRGLWASVCSFCHVFFLRASLSPQPIREDEAGMSLVRHCGPGSVSAEQFSLSLSTLSLGWACPCQQLCYVTEWCWALRGRTLLSRSQQSITIVNLKGSCTGSGHLVDTKHGGCGFALKSSKAQQYM